MDRIQHVSPHDVQKWLKNKEAVLIDVREAEEFEPEHIRGSVLNPVSRFSTDLIDQARGNKKVIFSCKSGPRAERALMHYAQVAGADNLYCLEGSITAWKQAGLPTSASRPPFLERFKRFLCFGRG